MTGASVGRATPCDVLLSPAERALAEAVTAARRERRPLRSRGDAWGVDVTGAYRVQASSHGGHLKGYKLGLISPAKQAQMGLETPIWGRVLAGMVREEGALAIGDFLQPRAEPELAVLLSRDVPAGAGPGAVWRAMAGFVLCADILDSVWEGYRFTAPEVIADNASGGALLLGERLLPPPAAQGTLRLYLEGRLAAEGPVAALGDPAERLAWLAWQVGGLEAGQLVALGSPAAAVELRPGLLEVVLGDACLWRAVQG